MNQLARTIFKNAFDLGVIEGKIPKFPKFLKQENPEVDEWLTEQEQLTGLREG